MNFYDISCFRHNGKSPSHIVYRLPFNGDDLNIPSNEIVENSDLAKNILIENKSNKNAEAALQGYYTRFIVFKYDSFN